jgi:hypothetical protein
MAIIDFFQEFLRIVIQENAKIPNFEHEVIYNTHTWTHDQKTKRPIFIARPQGTRRQGRPKSRWADEPSSR